jgi:hypothetical protein
LAKQLMFYEKVVPVDRARHARWSVRQESDGFGFARGAAAAPLMSAEFLPAATQYPIVFAKSDGGYSPVAMLGIETGCSLFVDEQGSWTGDYIPAFIRRYPFAFSASNDGSRYTLCIDESYSGCDPTGRTGEKLYSENDEPSPYLKSALEFARGFEVEHRRTREFCRLLAAHDLLEQMNAELVMPSGARRRLAGLHVVSRARLKKLEGEALADFFRRDALELIYFHHASLKNLEKLRLRANG